MIRIDTAADLADIWGSPTDWEVVIWFHGKDYQDIIGFGHTVSEAVAAARDTLKDWRETDAKETAKRLVWEDHMDAMEAEQEGRYGMPGRAWLVTE